MNGESWYYGLTPRKLMKSKGSHEEAGKKTIQQWADKRGKANSAQECKGKCDVIKRIS